jgi:conjugative relaxase-like TrwC/TraI family protein
MFSKRATPHAPRVHLRLGAPGFPEGAGVLSVAKLTLGQEAYYEQQVARGLDDYYAGRGESPGIWAGSGSAGLGLDGVVEDGDLGTLLRGVNPASDARLRSPVRERTITVRALDVETGEWREVRKRLAPVSGYDLVFSCPKSVSLLHALTDDERVRREVSEAHDASWQAALGYLEREACIVRRGRGGTIREHGQGFVAAAFRHRTSRAQDPHLHTHVIVANLARTPDGVWRALDGEAILKTYRLAAGYLYEARLRHELTRRLGLEWSEPVKGMGEIAAVPEQAIRAFSSRRQSLVEHMEALGTEGFAAARVAALATREAKDEVELPRLREEWQARAAEHGLGRRELRRLGRGRPLTPAPIDAEAVAVDELTAKRTTFTMPELVQAVAGAARDGATVEEILETAERLARCPLIEQLAPETSPRRPARFTTRDLLELERETLRLASDGRRAGAPQARVTPNTVLTREQRELVLLACLSAAPPCTGYCSTPTEPAGSRRDVCSSSTRRAWPRPACWRRCCGSWTTPRGRRSSSATPRSSRRSGQAASSPPSATSSERSPSPRTGASATLSSGPRSPASAPASRSPTSPTPPPEAASTSTATSPRPSSGCSKIGGMPPGTTPPKRSCSPTAATTYAISTKPPARSCSETAASAPKRSASASASSASATRSSAAATTPRSDSATACAARSSTSTRMWGR